MRILFLTDQFWPETNAPAIHVLERARCWVAAGHHVTVVTSAPNFPEGRLHAGYRNAWRTVEEVEGIRVVRVKTYIAPNEGFLHRILDYLSFLLSAIVQGLREERPDLVVSTSPQLFTPLAGLVLSGHFRVPHVFELRDLWPATITAVAAVKPGLSIRLLERLELWLYRRSDRILAFTAAFKKNLESRGVPAAKVEVVENGTNLDLFCPGARDGALAAAVGSEGKFVVGYFGTLGLCHGLEAVLQAAALLREEPFLFLLMGAGAARAPLEVAAKHLGLSNVRFLDRQPREAVPAHWRICDVALVSLVNSQHFGTVIPSKIYEAMAMGLPILFTGPAGEASMALEAWGAGLVAPGEDPEGMAAALRRLASDPPLREGMKAAGLRVSRGFGREAQAGRALDLFMLTLDQSRR